MGADCSRTRHAAGNAGKGVTLERRSELGQRDRRLEGLGERVRVWRHTPSRRSASKDHGLGCEHVGTKLQKFLLQADTSRGRRHLLPADRWPAIVAVRDWSVLFMGKTFPGAEPVPLASWGRGRARRVEGTEWRCGRISVPLKVYENGKRNETEIVAAYGEAVSHVAFFLGWST